MNNIVTRTFATDDSRYEKCILEVEEVLRKFGAALEAKTIEFSDATFNITTADVGGGYLGTTEYLPRFTDDIKLYLQEEN